MPAATTDASKRFSEIIKQMDSIYERYAKSAGLNYTSLYVLYTIYSSGDCTQKQLCELLYLPKQTVNSIIKVFRQQGLLQVDEMPDDRRQKAVRLTSAGRDYAARVLPPVIAAEENSLDCFSPEEQKLFLAFMERYARSFNEKLEP